MFKGRCAECNSEARSKTFRSRRAGYDIPPVDERQLSFAFESVANNKICHTCYLKNQRLVKRDRDEKTDRELVGAKMARLKENEEHDTVSVVVDNGEALEHVSLMEKEGTAISILLYLSKL